MQLIRDFSERALRHIKWWTWAAAVLPITALAGIFFVWIFGTESMFSIAISAGATLMFATAALWWWWIIWIVSKIMKKDRRVADELKETARTLKSLKSLVKETFVPDDK